ncbi:pseudouridine synthase [Cytophagales bacterium LB-30]|uniref:Pseudouridine synthase n=1 Tax=Shiella aurantiaca TaxID=3058365 RepID=A0ABT8F6V8_9BACT|nr:pseudouridine synthase [Shiella aurantiaca]MDN4166115.1 pseudouridine synthase [Shiella aurantiaca]
MRQNNKKNTSSRAQGASKDPINPKSKQLRASKNTSKFSTKKSSSEPSADEAGGKKFYKKPFNRVRKKDASEELDQSKARPTGRFNAKPKEEDKDAQLSHIARSAGKNLRSRGKKKEYTDKVENFVNPPQYDQKKLSHLSKSKGKAQDDSIRLNRYISNAGVCSRRDADLLIEMGEIKVNGKIVTEMGYKVQPDDEVRYMGKLLNREKMVYVLLNKPKDFITTTDDPQERKTVMQLVANAGKERIYPVGRLDRNTTGLLLLTNDGEMAMKLAHPSFKGKKIYMVETDKPVSQEDFNKIKNGLHLEDGVATVDDLAFVGDTKRFLGIEIHIGRNRIVRRIFESLGYEVKALDRVMYAGLTKKDLPRGSWRYLTEKEVINLKFF